MSSSKLVTDSEDSLFPLFSQRSSNIWKNLLPMLSTLVHSIFQQGEVLLAAFCIVSSAWLPQRNLWLHFTRVQLSVSQLETPPKKNKKTNKLCVTMTFVILGENFVKCLSKLNSMHRLCTDVRNQEDCRWLGFLPMFCCFGPLQFILEVLFRSTQSFFHSV